LLEVALPFFLGQLLLVGWFSRGARSALLPELYRWIFLFPILSAVLSTLLGRPRRFHVTPKEIPAQGSGLPARGLFAPLLALLGLQLLNLGFLIVGPGDGAPFGPELSAGSRMATQALSLVWALISVATLSVALRTCWDRPHSEATPWFAVGAPQVLWRSAAGPGQARLMAISETGLELLLGPGGAEAGAAGMREGAQLQLEWPGPLPFPLPVRIARTQRAKAGLRVGAEWNDLDAEQSGAVQSLLYRRVGQWPTRQAPFEPLALLAVLFRLLQPLAAQGWFQRSLLPLTIPVENP